MNARLSEALQPTAHRLEQLLARPRSPRGSTNPDDRWLDIGGARLRAHDFGSGPIALVFVPDPPNVLEHHRQSFEHWARDFRVIGLELPGFGFSRAAPGFGYSIVENAEVLTRALDALKVPRAVLCLPCVAGLVSLAAATSRPELVAGVVGIQSAGWPETLAWAERVDTRRVAHTPIVGQLMMRAQRRPLARRWYAAAAASDAVAAALSKGALEAYDRGAAYALASVLQGLGGLHEARLRPPRSLPFVSMWGKRDRTHRRTDPRSLQRHFDRVELVEFDEAGHFPDLEAPEDFRAALRDWLEAEVLV